MGVGLAAGLMLGSLGGVLAAKKASPASAPPAKIATAKKATKAKKTLAMYECKSCNVKSDKAGNCPKCGMAMTKIEAPKAKAKVKAAKGEKKGT
jgi:Heavy metal binding domain